MDSSPPSPLFKSSSFCSGIQDSLPPADMPPMSPRDTSYKTESGESLAGIHPLNASKSFERKEKNIDPDLKDKKIADQLVPGVDSLSRSQAFGRQRKVSFTNLLSAAVNSSSSASSTSSNSSKVTGAGSKAKSVSSPNLFKPLPPGGDKG